MEFLSELVLELILETIFGLTIENPQVKIRVKTGIFVVFSQLVAGVILWMGIKTCLNGNIAGGIVVCVISAALSIGFLIGAVSGHKRGWKQWTDN